MARPRSPRPLPLAFALVAAVAGIWLLVVLLPGAARWGPVSAMARAVVAEDDQLPPVPGPVVLIGTGGLRWNDIDANRAPALWSLLVDGAAGTVAARSLGPYSCPADGWLAVSTGRLAADVTTTSTEPCNSIDPVRTGEAIPRWPAYVAQSFEDERDARPGLLGSALAAGQVEVAAVGPGAAIATALTSGVPLGTAVDAPSDPVELSEVVAAAVDEAELLVVDVGATNTQVAEFGRQAQIVALDERVSAVLDAVPDDATVLVFSLADAGPKQHLQIALARGPGRDVPYDGGLLGSKSTRQSGLIQATDVTPTVLSLLGVAAPSTLVGSPVTALPDSPVDDAERLQHLRDFDAAAQAVGPYVVRFGVGLALAHVVAYAGSWVALRRRWGGERARRRVFGLLKWVTLLLAAVPVATYPANLIPWWRSPAPFLTLMGSVLAGALLVSLVAFLGPWRRYLLGPFGVVAAVTALALTADVFTGSRLMMSSLLGLQPLVAGRFYGLGNVAFALFATGALLAALALADRMVAAGQRGPALAAVLLIGVVAVVIDGAPGLGSDFGGPLAMIPAFAVLAFFVAQLRASWPVGLGVAAGTIAVVAALSGLDWLRPADERTHLGRFVEAMANGETWQVVGRKLAQNIDVLVSSPAGLLVPVVAVVLAVAVLRPQLMRASLLQQAYQRAPVLRPGLVALLLMLGLGFALNDSGTAIPAVSFALTVPLVVSVCASTALLDGRATRGRTTSSG